ncbi:hypothetical protein QR680_018448 [Steinernema hermaphroditum]|uniref:Uncharacterized protein n=1 Tax=Steinernema hermaphroditum TaxID=289476 RepID=A0AA39LQV3_9BILA|nr:hypothetical protein QR680_018448 [Steinernema hermaphroditum]
MSSPEQADYQVVECPMSMFDIHYMVYKQKLKQHLDYEASIANDRSERAWSTTEIVLVVFRNSRSKKGLTCSDICLFISRNFDVSWYCDREHIEEELNNQEWFVQSGADRNGETMWTIAADDFEFPEPRLTPITLLEIQEFFVNKDLNCIEEIVAGRHGWKDSTGKRLKL